MNFVFGPCSVDETSRTGFAADENPIDGVSPSEHGSRVNITFLFLPKNKQCVVTVARYAGVCVCTQCTHSTA